MTKKQREALWGVGGIAVVVAVIWLVSQVGISRLVGAREPIPAPPPKGACYVAGPVACLADRTQEECLKADLARPSWGYWAGAGTKCKIGLIHSFSKVTVKLADCLKDTGGDEAKIKENLRKACFKQFIDEKDKDSACPKGQVLIPDKELPPKVTDYVVDREAGECRVACATAGTCHVPAFASIAPSPSASSYPVSVTPSPTSPTY